MSAVEVSVPSMALWSSVIRPLKVRIDNEGLAGFGVSNKGVEPEASGDSVRAVRDRVRSAVLNGGPGWVWPEGRITIVLPEEAWCPSYDVPIAVGILVASGQLPDTLLEDDGLPWFGQLRLDGQVQSVTDPKVSFGTLGELIGVECDWVDTMAPTS